MRSTETSRLPIRDQLEPVLDALKNGSDVLLSAPPGAGKSTIIPGAVADQSWCKGKVLISQPRRLAAQALARRVAALRNCQLGQEVGYAVRFDRQTSATTRLEFLTAGLLLKRLQSDPFLDGIDCVILDEFHERSLDTDFCLALLLQIRSEARPDLRLIVMSATLDTSILADQLPEAIQVSSQGRSFPVSIEHQKSSDQPIAKQAAQAAARALKEAGRVLVFLPGVRAIQRCQDALKGTQASVIPLHGRLSQAEQQLALEPCTEPQIILATNIAETSLTIDGVHTVIDTGLERAPRYDAKLGLSRLTTIPISRASADQRAGRAGRLGPGRCIRLWSSASEHQRPAYDTPEIADAELSSTLLSILAWGQRIDQFTWFEAPPLAHQRRAITLLRQLGTIDDQDRITSKGRSLAQLPIHPRLGAVLHEGSKYGAVELACMVAALASEPDFLRHRPPADWGDDLSYRIEQLKTPQGAIDNYARKRVLRVTEQLKRLAPEVGTPVERPEHLLQHLLLAGFADRLARRNDDGSYAVASGFRAQLSTLSLCDQAELILGVALTAHEQAMPLIQVGLPVQADLLQRRSTLELRWDPKTSAVVHERVERLGELVIKRSSAHQSADPEQVANELFAALENQPGRALNWTNSSRDFANRIRFCRHHGARELPDPDDAMTLLRLICRGRRSIDDLKRADLAQALSSTMTYAMSKQLDEWAPTRYRLPRGRSAKVTYDDPAAPVLSARVQDFFGLDQSPTLAQGRATVVCHLLAPNGRPAQVTSDLAGFWAGSYSDVRKALRGRYPKHDWPEDPSLRNSS